MKEVNYNIKLIDSLYDNDPEIYELIKEEKERQRCSLELIASENFTSRAVMEANGSCLTNKYSEGLPGARYYGGNEFIDKIEILCEKRALDAFDLKENEWGVNVQPYSGSPANFEVYTGILQPHDRIMGLDLPSGGHLTHGYQTLKKKISATSIFFESMPYNVNKKTGLIDYDELEKIAKLFKPKLIICGASAYPREIDYARFRKIADKIGAYLMCDMAHTSGLIAGKQLKSPFPFCDIVTTTTHKTLRGPRSGVIFYRKMGLDGNLTDLKNKINQAVFPGMQGGPHNHTIAAVAVAMKNVKSDIFKEYSKQVCVNAKSLSMALMDRGYKLVTGGTDNHIVLLDLSECGVTGSKVEKVCDLVNISVNKNAVPGDISALSPSGLRLGTAALTSRSFKEEDFDNVAEFLKEAIDLTIEVQNIANSKMMKEFNKVLEENNTIIEKIINLRKRVKEFACKYFIPE